MDFEFSARTRDYLQRLGAFMDEHIYPNEERFFAQLGEGNRWEEPPLLEELQHKARAAQLWNLFLPDSHHGAGLSNLEYAPLCEMMGRVRWSSEVFNCSAPDTGNMETLERYGTPAQKQRWLEPLLNGAIRSAFAMTEPRVASSDATNIESSIVRDGACYVINGRKWWTSGAGSARCRLFIFMGKTDPGAPRHLAEHDPERVSALRHAPDRERGIVGAHRTRSDQHGVQLVAPAMDQPPRGLRADPLPDTAPGGQLAVEGHGRLEHHPGDPGGDELEPGLVGSVALRLEQTGAYVHSRAPQPARPVSVHPRVRVSAPEEHAAHPGGDQRLGARRRAPLVVAGLEAHVDRSACRLISGVSQSNDFCMRPTGLLMRGTLVSSPRAEPGQRQQG